MRIKDSKINSISINKIMIFSKKEKRHEAETKKKEETAEDI